MICVVLGGIKPRSDGLSETYIDRLAWATQYASYFLTFTIFGSLIFEDDAKRWPAVCTRDRQLSLLLHAVSELRGITADP